MKLSEIKQVLAERGVLLTKSLGQNFLHDGNQLRRILQAAQLSKEDNVLEVGPGLGPLTELLVKEAGSVLAIEKDARLVAILREHFRENLASEQSNGGRLSLVQADALEYLSGQHQDWTGWKLVANLPYAVASPILVGLAWKQPGPDRLVATLQLEVAHRLMSKPGDRDYGVLTLLVQLHYKPLDWFKIPASCFFPEPDVDSACVALVRRSEPLLSSERRETFATIVKRSFSQRRKMMAKLLRADWPADTVAQSFAELGLPLQTRGEAVSLDQFISLTNFLHERRNF
jgi:16S rRNA (adenine1518-N6/adenine1519-N6)-dimethyltransferase